MIYLIGGAPRVGKSILAKKLALLTKSTCISTDKICEHRAANFPLPGFSGDPSENILKPKERVNLQLVSARSLEPDIDRLIANAIHTQKSLIIEGIHILPDHAETLMKKYGSKKICSVFIGSNNINRVIEGIKNNTNPDNWLKKSNARVIRQVAEFAVAFSSYIKQDAKRHSCLYRERTDDFEADGEFVEKLLFRS